MIQKYFDIITKIENFVDGLMIVDENCIIRFNRLFTKGGIRLDERESVGKTPWEVYPSMTPEESTCYRAVVYGETTVNTIQKLVHRTGTITFLDNTFPVVENGKTIGAISASKFIDEGMQRDFIDLSGMTTSRTKDLYDVGDIIGSSKEILRLKFKIHKVSSTSSSVFIYGETGTGKELVAQSIHSGSPRKNACFISQNCAAIPHTLLESIFFGTTKGSYTGAENKAGIFEMADGGTIFLDEINSMDLAMQAKLLKAIEEKKITRIGGCESKRLDVRIISAINESPSQCMQENKMRTDLFYRLSGIQILVPPLRDHRSDIPELTAHFIRLFNAEMQKDVLGVSDEVMRLFNRYDWPGNIREFKNVLECAFNFVSGSTIQVDDLPDSLRADPSSRILPPSTLDRTADLGLGEAAEQFEKAFITARASQTTSRTELASLLKISKQTLNYKINKHGLSLPRD